MAKGKKAQPGSDDDDYEVGYGKPPKHSQFKPGHSGNPKGRQKGLPNFATTIRKLLKQKVVIMRDGKSQRVPIQEAGVIKSIQLAFTGNPRFMEIFLRLVEKFNSDEAAEASTLSPNDQALLDAYTETLKISLAAEVEALGENVVADEKNNKPVRGSRPLKRYRRKTAPQTDGGE
jgi:hypothetical protein